MAEKKKLGRKTIDDSKKKKPFILYFSDEEIERAGGKQVALVKCAKAILKK